MPVCCAGGFSLPGLRVKGCSVSLLAVLMHDFAPLRALSVRVAAWDFSGVIATATCSSSKPVIAGLLNCAT